jgi:hypothetical protein
MIAILGATGAVGRAASALLRERCAEPLRLGARRAGAGVVAADAQDDAALDAFCAGARVVVNCAGPSYRILDRVARAALRAGADYVDACGNARVAALLAPLGLAARGRTALLSAGMLPGLSGLLPRALAGGFDRVVRLRAYAGGADRFTRAAALDYLLGLDGADGEPLAAWRDGRRVSGALAPRSGVELPPFPGRVDAFPFFGWETERLARTLELREAESYAVFHGAHVLAALRRWSAAGGDAESAVDGLRRAAELDLAGRRPYQIVAVQLDGERDGRALARSAVLRAGGAGTASGAFAALAALALLEGGVPPGVHHAAEALDPHAVLRRLRGAPDVGEIATFDEALFDAAYEEEGVL